MPPYNLFIVESPAKCGKIEQYLGSGNKCIASYGHFREINGLTAINLHKNFTPTFMLSANKQSQVTKLRKAIKDAQEVFLATDDDREGEAIAWHLCDYFDLPVATTKRIVFHEVTEPALKRAVENYRYVNMAIVNAQFARQVLDILVGYKLSPMLWKNVKDGTSAGRCQTPALRLVYENFKDIQDTPGSKEYNITGYFTGQNIPFQLNYNFRLADGSAHNESAHNESVLDESANADMLSFLNESIGFEHVYKCGELRDTIKTPPTPFTTSKLQQVASSTLHMSPKETMSICQKLYEEGYITYMRTDSTVYASEFLEKTVKYITTEYGGEYVRPDIDGLAGRLTSETGAAKQKQPVLAQEAHEAIRPTNISVKKLNEVQMGTKEMGTKEMGTKEMGTKEMGTKECKMYHLIWSNTLESCMANALYKGLTATITAPQNHSYKFSTEQMLFSGWKIVNSSEEVNKEFVYLQTLKANSVLKYKKIAAKVSVKQLKAHYTEAKLVQLLEEKGIGRPSTFSALIEKIQDRGYVKKENVKGAMIKCTDYELTAGKIAKNVAEREFGNEKNKLVIKPLGIMVIEYLLKHFNALFDYDYTKHMETQLDAIATTHKVWHELCKECLTDIEASISTTAQECKGKETIRIDDAHVYMMGKYGPVIKCTAPAPALAQAPSAQATPAQATPAQAQAQATQAHVQTTNVESKEAKKNAATISFKPVNADLDLAKLRSGEYSLEQVLVEPSAEKAGRILGTYKEKDVVLRSGKFGWYIEWGTEKKALKLTLPEATALTLDDVAEMLFDLENGETGIIRSISKETSIRKGKFGDYIFHKNNKMKKPKFLKLAAFKGDYVKCDIEELYAWLKKTYDIKKCE